MSGSVVVLIAVVVGLLIVAMMSGCSTAGTVTKKVDEQGRAVRILADMTVDRFCEDCGEAEVRMEQVGDEPAELTVTGSFDAPVPEMVSTGTRENPSGQRPHYPEGSESSSVWKGREVRFVGAEKTLVRLEKSIRQVKEMDDETDFETMTAEINADQIERLARQDHLELQVCEPSVRSSSHVDPTESFEQQTKTDTERPPEEIYDPCDVFVLTDAQLETLRDFVDARETAAAK